MADISGVSVTDGYRILLSEGSNSFIEIRKDGTILIKATNIILDGNVKCTSGASGLAIGKYSVVTVQNGIVIGVS